MLGRCSMLHIAFLSPPNISSKIQMKNTANEKEFQVVQEVLGAPFSGCGHGHDVEPTVMREALQNALEGRVVSKSFIEALLFEPAAGVNPTPQHCFDEDEGKQQHNEEETKPLYEQMRGVPRKPFFRELSRRLSTICQSVSTTESNDAATLPFLPASHFGVTELQCMSSLVPDPPQHMTSVDECTKWLQNAGENGIMASLGMRRTIGTVTKCFQYASTDPGAEATPLFPPSISQLLVSSRQLHKPDTKSSLSVAARALAKHAHRGADCFFGTVKGSESHKNEHAEMVVQRLIREAAWINIHAFGGVDDKRPVCEVRTVEGYGARWSAAWVDNAFSPDDVEFRGFLEPNMEDGHENRWRH